MGREVINSESGDLGGVTRKVYSSEPSSQKVSLIEPEFPDNSGEIKFNKLDQNEGERKARGLQREIALCRESLPWPDWGRQFPRDPMHTSSALQTLSSGLRNAF